MEQVKQHSTIWSLSFTYIKMHIRECQGQLIPVDSQYTVYLFEDL